MKQPFTFGKYLLGVFLFTGLAVVASAQNDEYQIFFIYGVMLYMTLGFILWVYQTIKYGKLRRREQKLYEAELQKREADITRQN